MGYRVNRVVEGYGRPHPAPSPDEAGLGVPYLFRCES